MLSVSACNVILARVPVTVLINPRMSGSNCITSAVCIRSSKDVTSRAVCSYGLAIRKG